MSVALPVCFIFSDPIGWLVFLSQVRTDRFPILDLQNGPIAKGGGAGESGKPPFLETTKTGNGTAMAARSKIDICALLQTMRDGNRHLQMSTARFLDEIGQEGIEGEFNMPGGLRRIVRVGDQQRAFLDQRDDQIHERFGVLDPYAT